MEKVIAKIKYLRREHKKFYLFHLFHRSNSIWFMLVLIAILGVMTVYNVIKEQSVYFSLIMFGVSCGIIPFLIISRINQVVKQETPERVKSTDTIELTKHKITRSNDMVPGKAIIGWNNLDCVCENDRYFYFYTTENAGLFITKTEITEGSVELVRKLALENLIPGKRGRINYFRYGKVKREFLREQRQLRKEQKAEKKNDK